MIISKIFFIRYSRWSYRNANVFVRFNRSLCMCVPSQVIDNNIVLFGSKSTLCFVLKVKKLSEKGSTTVRTLRCILFDNLN